MNAAQVAIIFEMLDISVNRLSPEQMDALCALSKVASGVSCSTQKWTVYLTLLSTYAPNSSQRIKFIRPLREEFGFGLKEAVDIVDNMYASSAHRFFHLQREYDEAGVVALRRRFANTFEVNTSKVF